MFQIQKHPMLLPEGKEERKNSIHQQSSLPNRSNPVHCTWSPPWPSFRVRRPRDPFPPVPPGVDVELPAPLEALGVLDVLRSEDAPFPSCESQQEVPSRVHT